MLVFPNAKINLGLHVIVKRADGFHTIETAFYPVNWHDILEIIEEKNQVEPIHISYSGLTIDGPLESNLIYKAWNIISQQKKLPHIKVHLHKTIPMGAGLGGGSSDAAHFINLLDQQFNLCYSESEKSGIASQLGSDCAFFIHNKPLLAKGKGDELSAITIDLSVYYILLVYPDIHCNTKAAYEGLSPKAPLNDLRKILESTAIHNWKDSLVNDFEVSIFKKFPAIGALKKQLYNAGALYASLSGSGSTVFGIFEEEPRLSFPSSYLTFLQKPSTKIL